MSKSYSTVCHKQFCSNSFSKNHQQITNCLYFKFLICAVQTFLWTSYSDVAVTN